MRGEAKPHKTVLKTGMRGAKPHKTVLKLS